MRAVNVGESRTFWLELDGRQGYDEIHLRISRTNDKWSALIADNRTNQEGSGFAFSKKQAVLMAIDDLIDQKKTNRGPRNLLGRNLTIYNKDFCTDDQLQELRRWLEAELSTESSPPVAGPQIN